MEIPTVVKTVAVLLLPIILQRLIALFFKLRSPRGIFSVFRQHSRLDLTLLLISTSWLVFQVWNIIYPKNLYFSETRTTKNSPGYLIRNQFREYVAEQSRQSSTFKEMIDSRNSKLNFDIDKQEDDQDEAEPSALKYHYDRLEALSMELKSSEFRKLYIRHGDAALDCKVCGTEDWMLFLFSFPSVMIHYIISIFLVSISSPLKRRLKGPCISFLFVSLLLETYTAYTGDLSLLSLITFKNEDFLTLPEKLSLIRSCVLITISIIVLLFDARESPDPVMEGLEVIMRASEKAAAKLQTVRLAKLAILSDEKLKDVFARSQVATNL